MGLFGKKKKQKKENKKNAKKQKNAKPEDKVKNFKRPSDVKLFYVLPIILILGCLLIVTGVGISRHNIAKYNENVMAESMSKGRVLPLWGGDSKGNLILGNVLLSKNGKELAVEVKYTPEAHDGLSSFGDKYELRLIKTDDSDFDFDMKYGLFGTDGSGVLRIQSDKGFEDKSFVVMIIDRGQLVTSTDIANQTPSIMSNDEIDESITSRLSNPNVTEENQEESKKRLPPLYYVRLNGATAKKSENNWKNDADLVKDLFINGNIKTYKRNINKIDNQLEQAEASLTEMKNRLIENPDDKRAAENALTLQQTIDDLVSKQELEKNKLQELEEAKIAKDVLSPNQESYTTFSVSNLDFLKS